ncbi:hypothetical protein B0H21DRAFT_692005 [Amylocystis lapponica]|nr:hypothetical protein B0H21DRAFT_692010 [Amylocystis lapponica]KAH9947391.1 hypothetical protein B0H21DRAFT_692005 [Amylocystis lapponica]
MMDFMETEFEAEGIPFSATGNRVNCFPHVVNCGVQTGLEQLTKVEDARVCAFPPGTDHDEDEDNGDFPISPELAKDHEYWLALESDPVKSARSLVTACRASGQRREDYMATIQTGNSENAFAEKLPEAVLLRDVDTRWSSTFLMIDRVLEMTEAINRFLASPKQEKISGHALSAIDLRVISDIRDFLELPHLVQEYLSAEMTPTLSMVIPAYETLIEALKKLRVEKPEIQHGISACVARLDKYFVRVRKSKVCVIATGAHTGCISFCFIEFDLLNYSPQSDNET